MSYLKTSSKPKPKIFDALNAYSPEEFKKNIEQKTLNSNAFFSSHNEKPLSDQYQYLKSQNNEIFASKNRCAVLESDIIRQNKQHSDEITNFKEKISEYEKNHLTLQNENDRLCNTLLTLNAELEHLKKENKSLETKILQISLDNENLTRSNKLIKEDLAIWKEKISSGENSYNSLYEEMTKMKEELNSHNQIVEKYENEIEQLNENYQIIQTLCIRLKQEKEQLFEKNERNKQLLQASTEDFDEMKKEYNLLLKANEKKMEIIKEEENKLNIENNLKYQELLNRKNLLDENYKQLIQQNKELNQRIAMNENIILEKNHKIMDLESKVNAHDSEIEELIKEIGAKTQIIYQLKTENIKAVAQKHLVDSKLLNGSKTGKAYFFNDEENQTRNEEIIQKFQNELESEQQRNEKLQMKISHILKNFLLCCSENERLHEIIKSYKIKI